MSITETYVVITPSGVQLPLASQDWATQQITNATTLNNIYTDQSSSVTLSTAESYADTIVANRLAELLPTIPTPAPPATGYGAIKQWRWLFPNDPTKRGEEDGEYLIYRDQKYIDSTGANATASAITQANAYTLTQIAIESTKAQNFATAITQQALANAQLYTDAAKSYLIDQITISRLAAITTSKAYTDQEIKKIPLPITSITGAVTGTPLNGIINTTLSPTQTLSNSRFEVSWQQNSDNFAMVSNISYNDAFYQSIEYQGSTPVDVYGSHWSNYYDFIEGTLISYYKLGIYLTSDFKAKTTDYNGWLLKNVKDPVDAQDVATKQYVDDKATNTFSFEQFLTYIDRMDAS